MEITKYKIGGIYVCVLGIIAMGIGALEIGLGVHGEPVEYGHLQIPDDIFRGFILLSAGLFYIFSVCKFHDDLKDVHNLAKAVMGSAMIWILAGCDIFRMITASIPGSDNGWFNTLEGFLGTYAPPYAPEIFLLPFSLAILYFRGA